TSSSPARAWTVGGSTPRALITVALAVLAVAGVTALVFLVRAGGDPAGAATWPITWELRSSDNGPLFQFMQDVVAGRTLDWSFSPQVFVFPELPISALAFAITGGSIYGYYLVVAMLNAVLMFLALLALLRVLWRGEPIGTGVLRAFVSMVPLLVLPLVGTSWIFSFHLAPTYYIGMYLALVAAPVMLLTESQAVRIAMGVALALTIASNPLTLLFAAPGLVTVFVLGMRRSGWRAMRRPLVWAAGLLLTAGLLRLVFSPLQGTSPLTYVDLGVFQGRLAAIGPYFSFQARDPAAAVILVLGIALAVVCLAAAVAAVIAFAREKGRPADRRLLAVVFLGSVPLGGLAATFVALITHYYYFWPVMILPFALVLLALPRVAVPAALAPGSAILLAVAVATGGLTNLGESQYDGYRTAETRCIDAALPPGVVLGYATFSDARRLALTSKTPFRLIQVDPAGTPTYWLTNRAYARSEGGQFFYLNESGDELTIDPAFLRAEFGEPDSVVSCSAGQEVWIYTDDAKGDRIERFYATDR
ncbi:MAG: hypothetical protein ABIQ01_03205, partial [Pseudolysinimonas sp.]